VTAGTDRPVEDDIAAVARLIGDPTRAKLLQALVDADRGRSVTDLARTAGVTLPTISEHLRRLEEAGLVRSETLGRGRFFKLAGPDVARALEALALIAPSVPAISPRRSAISLG